jgi:hypothetical protein
MKLALSFLLIFTCLLACKKDEIEVAPQGLVGKWKLVSTEHLQGGKIVTQDKSADSIYIYFSKYGEVVNSEGKRRFCGPSYLRINGDHFTIQLKSEQAIEPFLSICADCPTWNVDLQPNEMTLSICSPENKSKYVRE